MTLVLMERRTPNAAYTILNPRPNYIHLKGHIAFDESINVTQKEESVQS